MSFGINCGNCGAPSSTSVGVCPFCKSVFENKKGGSKESPVLAKIRSDYKEGRIDAVLLACNEIYKSREKMKANNNFIIIYLKALIESDGPSSLVKSLVSQALLNDPNNMEVMDYLDLLEARNELSSEKNDPGEIKLKAIIKRSPKNPYAHFFLGAHLFWIDKDFVQAVHYLENAVKHRPTFLRAWGCLGALYKQLGNEALSKRAFAQAAKIETNTQMKKFFKKMT